VQAKQVVAALVLGGLLVTGVAGCAQKGPAERAGENIDQAAKDVKEGAEKAADKVEDAAEELQEKVQDGK
jgi:outer membrane murein-binding lipoprotein Lpp